VIFAALALVFLTAAPAATPAAAQGFNPFGWMQQMFGRPQRYDYRYDYQYRHRQRTDNFGNPIAPRPNSNPTDKAEKEKKPAVPPTFFVAVMGDSLSQLLAQGMTEAMADQLPEVGVLNKGHESSGLVRDDFFDWAAAVKELLASGQKINVAVMLIGSNDHQAIRENGTSYDPGTPEWNDAYAKRIETIAGMFHDAKVPLLWVGLPIMKNERFSAEMASLNDLYREHAAKAGATFIDVWDDFSDEQGRFTTYGPDVNGQSVRIRSADGVHFTRAGARKLAEFVDPEIKRIFDANKPKDDAALATIETTNPAGTSAPNVNKIVPVKPPIGPVLPLTGPALAPGGELASGAQGGQKNTAQSVVERTFINGDSLPPKPGRADDFAWPPK
jgi:uncharacterized protein